MTIDLGTAAEGLGGLVTAIGGVYTAIHQIRVSSKKKQEKHRQEILDQAKTEMGRIEVSFNEKITALENDLENHKVNTSKDLIFMKATYAGEVKVLGDKIESIREQLNQQHSQLLAVLTRMIDKK